nr:small multi-drug export protein [uncultured Oscillibacter sp.]
MLFSERFLETVSGELLMTFLVAMVPVIELRGAIPAGIAAGLSPALACLAAIAGNLVPAPLIMLLGRRVANWLRGTRFFGPKIAWLERRAHLKGRLVRKYRLAGLVILVGVPLPGTGAWTGALVASALDIRMRHALPAIFLGLVIAAAITTAITLGLFGLLI